MTGGSYMTIYSITEKLLRIFLKKKVSVLAFGAENTGKTGICRRLQSGDFDADRVFPGATVGMVNEEVDFKVMVKGKMEEVKIRYIDIGGDYRMSQLRKKVIADTLPACLLLFLDHNSPNGAQIQHDCGQINDERMKRHKDAIDELKEIIKTNPKVQEACKAIVVVVNKHDLWHKETTKAQFETRFLSMLQEFPLSNNISIEHFIECSAYTGHGINAIAQKVFESAGRTFLGKAELPFNPNGNL